MCGGGVCMCSFMRVCMIVRKLQCRVNRLHNKLVSADTQCGSLITVCVPTQDSTCIVILVLLTKGTIHPTDHGYNCLYPKPNRIRKTTLRKCEDWTELSRKNVILSKNLHFLYSQCISRHTLYIKSTCRNGPRSLCAPSFLTLCL